jgi:MtaA/CmuA family methyltransferase
MKKNSPKEEIIRLLNYRKSNNIPEFIPISTPIIDIMKETGVFWPEAHKNPEMMADLALGMSALTNCINIPFDMTLEAEALGCSLKWGESIDSTPQVSNNVFNDIDEIKIDYDIFSKGRFPVVLESLRMIKKKNTEDAFILPLVCGPLTVANHTIGSTYMFKILLRDKEKAKKCLNIFKDFLVSYSRRLLKAGADSILMLSPNDSGLGGNIFSEILIPIYRDISRDLNKKLVLHICGNVNRIIDYLPETDIPAFSFDIPSMDIDHVIDRLKNKMILIGGVPTIDFLMEGDRKMVFDQSVLSLKKGVDILAPSCCFVPRTNKENILAMMDAIKSRNINP